MKKFLLIVACAITLLGCYRVLELQEQENYNNAVEKCGGASNLIEKYTSTGEVYYYCK